MMALRATRDGLIDLAYDGGLLEGPDIITAVLVSLFSDARVTDTGLAPAERRGYWGDATLGNRIWVAIRRPLTELSIIEIRQAAADSLQWMVRDEVASRVVVDVTRLTRDSVRLAVIVYQGENVIWQAAWRVTAAQVEVLSGV